MDSDNAEPVEDPTPVQGHPTPVQGQPTAHYTLFEKFLKKTAKILRQSR